MKTKILAGLGSLLAAALLIAAGAPAQAQSTSDFIYLMDNGCILGTLTGCPLDISPEPYARAAVPVTASSGDVAAATATATLAAATTKTTYLSGFDFTSSGATAASTVVCTITGTVTGTLTYDLAVVAGATLANGRLNVQFEYPIPASAVNTPIVVSCPSLGSGNLHAAMNAYGFQR